MERIVAVFVLDGAIGPSTENLLHGAWCFNLSAGRNTLIINVKLSGD